MSDLPTYVLERTFEAPGQLVWRTWTEPDLLARWYGPNVETIIHRLEVEVGGLWLNEMRMRGMSSFQRTEYIEVVPPKRLVCLMSSADADWNVVANPMMPDWPRTLLTEVVFEERNGRTSMRLTWTPHDASDAEVACFAAMMGNMGKGWDAGMVLLAAILGELQPH
jgi:uncharacterized protein YndB with AHSA1/START domain